jgi:molybdopterin molybdotransferase
MIPVTEAKAKILEAFRPLAAETVGLAEARGRVLAEDARARVSHPPADVSAMDGYALRAADGAEAGARLEVVGEAPAGGAYERRLEAGQAVRIFTGGPVPAGADAVIMQEHCAREGDEVILEKSAIAGKHLRRAGMDFARDEVLLTAGRRLGARDLALAAAMNLPWLTVRCKPRITLIATGDEVVMPGEPLGPNQIVSSNSVGLGAFIAACGGEAINLGIARDDRASLEALCAGARGSDLLVTSGGVSVGERDLIRVLADEAALEVGFWKIAMRPGKPLLFGRLGETPLLGLPGNPVSAMVCAALFLRPAIGRMLGRKPEEPPLQRARLARPLAANDLREDYLRAALEVDPEGVTHVHPFDRQDSAMMAALARADCLIRRPAHDGPREAGEEVAILPLADGI